MQFSVQEEVVILAEAKGCSGLFDIKSCYPFLKHFLDLFCAGNVSVSVHSLTAFLYTTLLLRLWFFGEPSWVEILIIPIPFYLFSKQMQA